MSFQKKHLNLRGGGKDRERRQGESERDWERDHSHLKQGQTPLFLESSQSRKTKKFLHTWTQTHPHKLTLTHLHTHNAPSTSHTQLGSHFTWTRCTAHAPNPVPKGDRASQWHAFVPRKSFSEEETPEMTPDHKVQQPRYFISAAVSANIAFRHASLALSIKLSSLYWHDKHTGVLTKNLHT